MTTWSASQAARHLGVSHYTVYKMWRAGKLVGSQAGPRGRVHYDPDSVAAYQVVRAAALVRAVEVEPYWQEWWRAGRAGQVLGINGAAVRRLVRTGQLRGIQPNPRSWMLIDPADVERYRLLRISLRAYAARRKETRR